MKFALRVWHVLYAIDVTDTAPVDERHVVVFPIHGPVLPTVVNEVNACGFVKLLRLTERVDHPSCPDKVGLCYSFSSLSDVFVWCALRVGHCEDPVQIHNLVLPPFKVFLGDRQHAYVHLNTHLLTQLSLRDLDDVHLLVISSIRPATDIPRSVGFCAGSRKDVDKTS